MRELVVDGEGEVEGAAAVETFVRSDGEREVEDVIGIGEVQGHGGGEGEFRNVWE